MLSNDVSCLLPLFPEDSGSDPPSLQQLCQTAEEQSPRGPETVPGKEPGHLDENQQKNQIKRTNKIISYFL